MQRLYLKQDRTWQANTDGKYVTVYKVIKVIGAVRPYVGEELSKDHVADLCEQTGVWVVTIT